MTAALGQRWRAVLLLAAGLHLSGCTPPAPPGPAVAWSSDIGACLAVATLNDATIVAAAPGDVARTVNAAGELSGRPFELPPSVSHLLAVDLDGDGAAELVAAGSAGQAAAYTAEGRRLWQARIPAGPVFAMAAADVSGAGRPLVALGGGAPLGLTVLADDGSTAWSDPLARSVFAVAARPAQAGREGRILAVQDTGLIRVYDAVGEAVGHLEAPLIATAMTRVNDRLVISGREPNGSLELAVATALSFDGTVIWPAPVPVGTLPDLGRGSLAAADFDGDGTLEVAAVDALGAITWLGAEGRRGVGPELDEAVLSVAVGPARPEGGRLLLIGTSHGVRAVALPRG